MSFKKIQIPITEKLFKKGSPFYIAGVWYYTFTSGLGYQVRRLSNECLVGKYNAKSKELTFTVLGQAMVLEFEFKPADDGTGS